MLHRHPQGWQRAAEFARALRRKPRRGHVIHREGSSRSSPVTRSEYECRETRTRYSERVLCRLVRTAMVSASRTERARQTDVEGPYFNAGASSVRPCPPSRVCSGFSRPTLRVIKQGHCSPQSLTNPPPVLNTCASLPHLYSPPISPSCSHSVSRPTYPSSSTPHDDFASSWLACR